MRPVRVAIGIALVALMGCAAPVRAPHSSPAPAVSPQRTSSATLLDAPRVRRLHKRGWVEVDAEVLASDEEAPAAARARAVRRARQAAVEYVAGVAVRSSLLSLEQARGRQEANLLQVLTATQSDALVIDEELLGSRVSLQPGGGYRVRVTLRARVLDHGRNADEEFKTEVRLNQGGFREGEEVQLSVRASRDARIYVVGVSDDGAVVLLPNRQLRDTRIEANEWLRFPGPKLSARGIRLEAQLPDGKSESREALVVVALRGDRRLEDVFPASTAGTFRSAEVNAAPQLLNDLLAPLLEIPARDWTFDQLVYSVYGR